MNSRQEWYDQKVTCPGCGYSDELGVFVGNEHGTYDTEQLSKPDAIHYDWGRYGLPTEFPCPKCQSLIIYDVDIAPKNAVRGYLYVMLTCLGLVGASFGLIVLNIKIDGIYDSSTVSLLKYIFGLGMLLVYVSYRLYTSGSMRMKKIGVSVALIASGALLFFVSWFVHPVQSRSRCLDYLIECEVEYEMAPPIELIRGMETGEYSQSDSAVVMASISEDAWLSRAAFDQHVQQYGNDPTWSTSIWRSIAIAFPGLIMIIVASFLLSGWTPVWRKRHWNR